MSVGVALRPPPVAEKGSIALSEITSKRQCIYAQRIATIFQTGGYYPPASKDTNIAIEINYINITKLLLFCRGEPCSPIRVQCIRLHALRAKLNAQFMLYQNRVPLRCYRNFATFI